MRLAALVLSTALIGCHPSERFESVGQIVRSEVIEADEKGKPLIHDIEFEWSPCPGDQFQVVRGGAEFADCIKQHSVGDMVTIHVERYWDSHGYYRWDVTRIGECERAMQPEAEGSYEKSAECSDVMHFGSKVGFSCNRKPFAKLVEICPWMARD